MGLSTRDLLLIVGAVGLGIVALFILSRPAAAARRTGDLTVHIHPTTSFVPIPGAIVHITLIDLISFTYVDQTKVTDANGNALFPGIPEGNYHITVTASGYNSVDATQFVTFDADGTTQHSFGLNTL